MRRLMLTALALTLAGCAIQPRQVYSGPRLPADQEVRISTESENRFGGWAPGADRRIYLVKIDGQDLTDWKGVFSGAHDAYPTEAYVKPGRHELEIRYAYLTSYADARLWFEGEAGKAYLVRYRSDGQAIQFWIEDVAAGKPVGGHLP